MKTLLPNKPDLYYNKNFKILKKIIIQANIRLIHLMFILIKLFDPVFSNEYLRDILILFLIDYK